MDGLVPMRSLIFEAYEMDPLLIYGNYIFNNKSQVKQSPSIKIINISNMSTWSWYWIE
jgi:hypothetical protein